MTHRTVVADTSPVSQLGIGRERSNGRHPAYQRVALSMPAAAIPDGGSVGSGKDAERGKPTERKTVLLPM